MKVSLYNVISQGNKFIKGCEAMIMLTKINDLFSILKEKKGQATVEYGLILVAIVVIVVVGLRNIAEALVNFFSSFVTNLR